MMTKTEIAALKQTIDHLEHCLALAKIGAGGKEPEHSVGYVLGGLGDVARELEVLRKVRRRGARRVRRQLGRTDARTARAA